MTSYTPKTYASGDTLPATDMTALNAAVGSLATESVAVVPRSRIGSGTPAAGMYVDGGTGAWEALPTGGGGGTTPGAWQTYTLIAGLTVEDPADQPAWRDMGDGTVQVYTGRVLNGTGGQLAAFASYVEAPAGFPTLTRQSDTWNNLQVRATGVLVTKSAVNVDAQLPPSGQGNVYVFRVDA